jgi:biofilm PGA synthesis N-glycosyltransferase PgaC
LPIGYPSTDNIPLAGGREWPRLRLNDPLGLGGLKIPKISIGICAYNEQQNIAHLLNNLLTEQNLNQDSEILVVCSGCTDSTPEVVKRFADKDRRIRLIIEEERLGKSSAINIILEMYRGDFVFLIPADVIPAKSALSVMVDKISADSQIGVLGGSPIPVNSEDGFSGYLSHLMWRIHNQTLKYLDNLNLGNHASGEFMVLRSGIVEKIPVDVVNDDAYIAVEASMNGCKVKYCDEAKVYIKAPSNIPDYIRQRRRVVYGHHCVKKSTSDYPKTVENMMLKDPTKSINVLKEEVKQHPRDTIKLSVVILIEALVNALAITDLAFKKNHTVWKVSTSTKKIKTS